MPGIGDPSLRERQVARPAPIDLLRWPIVGRVLRWRHARTSFQLVLLAVATLIVVDGLIGEQTASANLSTVLVWVHTRGLIVVALLAMGNLFCAGCPFVRVRDWGRRLHMPRLHWPARLRGKWIGILLFAAVLFTYELFDLWSLPAATAWLVLAYFAAALAIDLVFTGASFCKHLCPIGQFNFMASTMSPMELRVRETGVCESCRTEDCIAGRRAPGPARPILQRGCETGLFLPAKVGNLDCTFCLDCVQACPHDNIAIAVRLPALELTDTRRRSAIGRIADRPDVALLAVLFVFGAMINALGMIAPVRGIEMSIGHAIGTHSEAIVLGILFAIVLGVVPLLLLGGAGALTRLSGRDDVRSTRQIAMRYVFGLVPLGFGMWLAHYGFHLLTGALTVVPVAQYAAVDLLGQPLLGQPMWQWTGMRPGTVLPIQIGLIALGAMGSLGAIVLMAQTDYPRRERAALAPWAAVVLLLAAAAVWILFQPMDMRGMAMGG